MDDEFHNFLLMDNRDMLSEIWDTAKAGKEEELEGEEKQLAKLMKEHKEYYEEWCRNARKL